VLPEATEVLNRKRASFLVTVSQEYGLALAEVFALFVIHSAFDTDLKQVLRQLAQDKRLGQTLEADARCPRATSLRGIHLADSPDRPERLLGRWGPGALQGLGEVMSSAPLFEMDSLPYTAQKSQLPPPYRHALSEVESALAQQALEPRQGTPGFAGRDDVWCTAGLLSPGSGVGHGAYSLTEGPLRASHTRTDASSTPGSPVRGRQGCPLLLGGPCGPGHLDGSRAGTPGAGAAPGGIESNGERLRGQLGSEGLQELARYLRADPQAALLVAEGGEAGAAALYEARGNVPKAQAWLSQAKSDRPGSSRTGSGAGKSQGGVASLADDAAGLSREVLETKLLELELEIQGPRLSGDVAMLEKQLTALEKTPPAGATSPPLWSEYLEYGRERLADLRQGTKVRKGRALEPPLKWEGYQQMRELWLRGLAFERDMAKLLRDDAALPRAQRRFLQDFEVPRVETYIGVRKPTTDLRFADVLVIEQKPLPGSLLAWRRSASRVATSRAGLHRLGSAMRRTRGKRCGSMARRSTSAGQALRAVSMYRGSASLRGRQAQTRRPKRQKRAVNRTTAAVTGVRYFADEGSGVVDSGGPSSCLRSEAPST
jgi:hypothetical protein